MRHKNKMNENTFDVLWDLPAFPLTEKFGNFSGIQSFSFDQSLVIDKSTGDVQLSNQIPPSELYSESNYNFRTSETGSSIAHLNKFLDFFNSCVDQDKKFKVMVDIGGNDLATVKKLKHKSEKCAVVDPICASIDNDIVENVKVIGRFIEDVNLETELDRPDLVICRHTIEHISNPCSFIEQLFNQCDEECLFIFEMPCFESLLSSMRLDAIFHQHVNYFDIKSFRSLLDRVGGESHAVNHQGPCGGSLYVCFKRRSTKLSEKIKIDVSEKTNFILKKISVYESFMKIQSDIITELNDCLYGYGAGLMTATLAYHLKLDMSKLACILDDDPAKHNTGYENLDVLIRNTNIISPEPNMNYLITSLENIRPIYKRIISLNPKRVIIPCLLL